MAAAEITKALLLDLDGTLVDSLPDLTAALNALLAAEGRPALAPAQVRTMVGDGVAKLVERGLAATGGVPGPSALKNAVARFTGTYEAAVAVESRPFPGVPETLAALRTEGWRLAVCTNKLEAASRALVEALGLSTLLDAVAGGDSFAVRKPDPGHLTAILERLGAAPEAAVMVGDSRNDVLAARAAGLPVIVMAYGYGAIPARELGADRVLERFDELPEALRALVAQGA
jgi:phosphoglycolate phosphatase